MADYRFQVGKIATFTPQDNTLTSYNWSVNNNSIATTQTATYTFNNTGTFTVRLDGNNSCGNCTPVEKTVEITTEAPQDNTILIVAGAGIGLALLYFMTKKK